MKPSTEFGWSRWVRLFLLTSLSLLITILAGCGGDGDDLPDQPELLPTISEDTNPSGDRIDVSSKNYFPLGRKGDFWLYSRRENDTEIGTLRCDVCDWCEPATDESVIIYQFDESEDELVKVLYRKTTEGIWITPEGVWFDDPFEFSDNPPPPTGALPWFIEYPTPFYPVGAVRRVVRQGSLHADIDNDGKTDYFRVELTQVFRGFEHLEVMGLDTEVAHFSTRIKFTTRRSAVSVNQTIIMDGREESYFASNIGLVRSDRSETTNGVVVRKYQLVLVQAIVAGVPLGVP